MKKQAEAQREIRDSGDVLAVRLRAIARAALEAQGDE